MKSQISGIALLGVTLLASQARATVVTINFDDLTPGCTAVNTATCASPRGSQVIIVSNQYFVSDGVTFSSNGNFVVLVESGTGYNTTSQPNIISTGTTLGTIVGSPSVNLILTFANPVFNLNFDAYGNDSTSPGGTFAQADLYQNGSSTPTQSNVNLIATNGNAFNGIQPDHQDLSAFAGITKLVIKNDTDVNGSAYDNFSFTVNGGSNPPVPEPSTLLLTGLCGIVWAGRRFLTHKSL
jgi:hypothetical protein